MGEEEKRPRGRKIRENGKPMEAGERGRDGNISGG